MRENRDRSRGCGGRGRAPTHRNRLNRNETTARIAGPFFKGNTDSMNGNVFQCHGESTDKQQFLILGEHVNKTLTYPQDAASVCKSFKIMALVQPEDLSEEDYKNSMGKKRIWETAMKRYMKQVDLLESNARAIYAIVWGQCSPMMQSKLKLLENYEARSDACDCIWLIQEMQGITHRFEGMQNVFILLDNAWTAYYGFQQGQHQVLHDYLKDFQTKVQVLEHYGDVFGADGPHHELPRSKRIWPPCLLKLIMSSLPWVLHGRNALPSVFEESRQAALLRPLDRIREPAHARTGPLSE
jgi:hypothetical protein